MVKSVQITGMILLGSMVLMGCMGPPRHKESMGDAARSAFARQIADPQASDRRDPGTGLNGPVVERAVEKYETGFGAKPKKEYQK